MITKKKNGVMPEVTKPKNSLEKSSAAERFGEYAIGLTLLLKGWEEVENFHHFPFRVGLIFFFGLFIIAGTKFHRQLAERAKSLPGIFHLLEGLAEIVAATIFFEEGKRWLPPCIALTGLFYCSLGLGHLLANEDNHEKVFSRLRVSQGIGFILFAGGLSVANMLIHPDPYVLLCAAILLIAGIILILKRHAHPRKRIPLAFKLYDRLRQKRAAKNPK